MARHLGDFYHEDCSGCRGATADSPSLLKHSFSWLLKAPSAKESFLAQDHDPFLWQPTFNDRLMWEYKVWSPLPQRVIRRVSFHRQSFSWDQLRSLLPLHVTQHLPRPLPGLSHSYSSLEHSWIHVLPANLRVLDNPNCNDEEEDGVTTVPHCL